MSTKFTSRQICVLLIAAVNACEIFVNAFKKLNMMPVYFLVDMTTRQVFGLLAVFYLSYLRFNSCLFLCRYDYKTDIWALGCVLFELLTLQFMFISL